jgi:hypothetical protein
MKTSSHGALSRALSGTLPRDRIGFVLGIIGLLVLSGAVEARTVTLTRQSSVNCQPGGRIITCNGHATAAGPRGTTISRDWVSVLTPRHAPLAGRVAGSFVIARRLCLRVLP